MDKRPNRTEVFHVRLTPQELDALKVTATNEGRTPSQVIRTRVFGVPLPVIPVMQNGGPVEVR